MGREALPRADLAEPLGQAIAARLNTSQRALADAVGVSTRTVERWLHGRAAMTVDNLELIAITLRTQASTLLREAEERRAAAQADEVAARRLAKSTPRQVAAQDERRPPQMEDPVLE